MRLFSKFFRKKSFDFEFSEVKLAAKMPEGYRVVEEYWLIPHFAAAKILTNGRRYYYALLEPEMKRDEWKMLEEIKEKIFEVLPAYSSEKDPLFKSFITVVQKITDDSELLTKFWYYVERDCSYVGKITPILRDPFVEDISCGGYNKPVFVYHSNYESMPTNIVFDEDELDSFVVVVTQKAGIDLSIANPIADTTLFDGSRINVTYKREITDHGSTFSIRKIRKEPVTPVQLINWGTFSAEEFAFLWAILELGGSILFVGGTAAGKTTAMNATALFIPINSKIVSIEDTREIILPHKNWIPSVSSRMGMFDLLKAAVRQRPEYILVGEVRGREAEIMFQAMSLGHACLSTVHGADAESVIRRLEGPPYNIPKPMISMLDLIVVMGRCKVGERVTRRCKGIYHISGNGEIKTVFRWDQDRDFHRSELDKTMPEICSKIGNDILPEDVKDREKILRELVGEDVSYEEFLKRIH